MLIPNHRGRAHAQLRDRADVLTAGDTEVDIRAALDRLQTRGFRRVLCRAAPACSTRLISADLVDGCASLSPTLAAAKPVRRPGVPLRDPAQLSLQHACTIDDYLYLRYRRARR